MSAILRDVAVHAIVGNAPRIITVKAEATPPAARTFYGTGAPTTSTLAVGNGKYNAVNSGYVVNASLAVAGSLYNVGDILSVNDACSTHMQITVDMVDGSGEIVNWHISAIAICSAYPSLPVDTINTTGAGLLHRHHYANRPHPLRLHEGRKLCYGCLGPNQRRHGWRGEWRYL